MPGSAKNGTPPPSGGVAKCLENHVQQSWSQREIVGVDAVILELVECERGEHEPANPRKRELPYVIPVIFSLVCFLPRSVGLHWDKVTELCGQRIVLVHGDLAWNEYGSWWRVRIYGECEGHLGRDERCSFCSGLVCQATDLIFCPY